MMAAHGISRSLSSGQKPPKKGLKSPPMTDGEEEKSEGLQEEAEFEVKVEELINASKKRKRGDRKQRAPRKGAGKRAKSTTILKENERNMKNEGIEEEE